MLEGPLRRVGSIDVVPGYEVVGHLDTVGLARFRHRWGSSGDRGSPPVLSQPPVLSAEGCVFRVGDALDDPEAPGTKLTVASVRGGAGEPLVTAIGVDRKCRGRA